jgi:hypothetical protein
MDSVVKKNGISIVTGDAHPQLAQDVARLAGARVISAIVSAFAYGETRVRIKADVQDADLLPCAADFGAHQRAPHEADLAGGRGAGRGVLARNGLVPYFGYARQEHAHCAPPSPPHWFAGPAAGTGVDQTEGKRIPALIIEAAVVNRSSPTSTSVRGTS